MDGYFYIPAKKQKRRNKNVRKSTLHILQPPDDNSLYVGDLKLGHTTLDIPPISAECKAQIVNQSDVDVLQMYVNDECFNIDLHIDSPFVQGLFSTRIFNFSFRKDGEEVMCSIYFKSLPLEQPKAQCARIISTLFAILFSIDQAHKGKNKCLNSEHVVNDVYRQIRKHQRETGLIEEFNTKNANFPFLCTDLRPYQQQAVRWMQKVEAAVEDCTEISHPCFIEVKLPQKVVYWNPVSSTIALECPRIRQQFQGGILADEMGLGKTIELLALILADYSHLTKKSKSVKIHTRVVRPRYRLVEEPPEIVCSPAKSYARLALQVFYDERVVSVNREQNVKQIHVACICGSHEEKNLAKCSKCGKQQHAKCMGFDGSANQKYICPQCWSSEELIDTNCTLLICPTSLRQQWLNEISTHVRYPLRVLDYTETPDLASVYPRTLAGYDIVLTTYTVLHGEFRKLEPEKENSLRRKRRYSSPGCPFMLLNWKRICLDEAQMVENSNSMISETAFRLRARYRWAITGTPISKSISDLYGIIEFLHLSPFSDPDVFFYMLNEKFERGDRQAMIEFLAHVLWRTAKSDVLDQIDLGAQTLRVHNVHFSHIERYFYDCELAESQSKFSEKLANYDPRQVVAALKANELKDVLQPIVAVRRVCVHHTVVNGRYLMKKKPVNSIKELLDALITRNINDTEETLRMIASIHNGAAGIYQLQGNRAAALHEYMKLIALEENFQKNKLKVAFDKLPLIHMFFNLRQLIVDDAQLANVLQSSNLIETQYTPALLALKLQSLENEYIQKFVQHSKQSIATVKESVDTINELERNISNDAWFADVVMQIYEKKLHKTMIKRVQNMMENYDEYKFRPKQSLIISSFMKWTTEFTNARCQIIEMLNGLYEITASGHITFAPELIAKAVFCHVRPPKNRKPEEEEEECVLCTILSMLRQYAKIIFAEKVTDVQHNVSWKSCYQEIVGRVIVKVARQNVDGQDAVAQGKHFFAMLDLIKKEFKELRKQWTELNFHICAFDELEQCKLKMKLKPTTEANAHPPTARTLNQLSYEIKNHLETINEVNEFEMNDYLLRMQTEVALYQDNLKQFLGTRNYLESLHNRNVNGQQIDPCPICGTSLENQWTVLRCGHSFCINCLDTQIVRSTIKRQKHFTCAVCRQVQSTADVNYVDSSAAKQETDAIKGNCSSKVAAIVKLVMELQQDDEDVKILLFSTWLPVLKVLEQVFRENKINAKVLSNAKVSEAVKLLRSKVQRITVLLMPISQGSKGLTLIEATHIIFAEPLLDPADELQAIGRIHRFGQNKATVVHKFIVSDTIEEEIHKATSAADKFIWNKSEMRLEQLRDLLFANSAQTSTDDEHVL